MEIQHIGRYDIKSLIGQGGMSTVYLGYDPRFLREVAIKVLPPYYVHADKFRDRFEQRQLRGQQSVMVQSAGGGYVVQRDEQRDRRSLGDQLARRQFGESPGRWWWRYGVEQWQLCGEQSGLGQRRDGQCGRGNLVQRDERRDRRGLGGQLARRQHRE